jgi:hypothetical protein
MREVLSNQYFLEVAGALRGPMRRGEQYRELRAAMRLASKDEALDALARIIPGLDPPVSIDAVAWIIKLIDSDDIEEWPTVLSLLLAYASAPEV